MAITNSLESILAKVGVEYRKPYNTRHTLISHALDRGMNPVAVAELTALGSLIFHI